MGRSLTDSIPLPPAKRVCEEHLCKIFNENRIWERAEAGELKCRIDRKPKTTPFTHHNGMITTHNEILTVWDSSITEGNFNREIASLVHRHVTQDGRVGGSGKWDPGKGELVVDGVRYRKYKSKDGRQPHCELCESGDRIEESERHFGSQYPKE